MKTEKLEVLASYEQILHEQVQNLKNSSNDSLSSNSEYCFTLCNAKISFLNSLINSIQFAIYSNTSEKIIDGTIEAIKHVEQNLKSFFLSPCDTVMCELPNTEIEYEYRQWRIVYKSDLNRVLLLTYSEQSCKDFLIKHKLDESQYIIQPTGERYEKNSKPSS